MLRVLDFFAGVGAFDSALERLGVEHELVDAVEIDPYAMKAFNAIHGTNFGCQDITKWDKNVGHIDIMWQSSPCFVAGTPILTGTGYKNIEDVEVGDTVLSHDGGYHSVVKVCRTESQQTYRVEAQGFLKTEATGNHPFYAIKRTTIQHHSGREYQYSEPEWIPAEKLTKDHYIALDIPQGEKNPRRLTEEECWLLGRYLADGHLRYKAYGKRGYPGYQVVYSVGDEKVAEFEKHLKEYKASIYPHTQSTHRIAISSKALVGLIQDIGLGEGAVNKTIPDEILNLPREFAGAFLDGYISGDGCHLKRDDSYSCTTISKNLAMSLTRLIARVYRVGARIYYVKTSDTHVIEGRVVNQHDQYQVKFVKDRRKASRWFLMDEKIWFKVRKVEKVRIADVYNLEVADSHSYTANNIIVHNCQDISVAGKQEGADKDAHTRSSLVWEVIRIAEKVHPSVIFWENVKGLTTRRHKHILDEYISDLEKLGYASYWKVLNSKNFCIPQNRERCFIVSILGGGGYEFPEDTPLLVRLKDILDKEVDEKYYLSDEKVQSIKFSTRHADSASCMQIGTCEAINGHDILKRIYSAEGIAPTCNTCGGGNTETKVVEEPFIVASRGRNPENPSARTIGAPTEQRLEGHADGISNTLTTVMKDNYVALYVPDKFRVRKLTPSEYFKLQGFTEEEFKRAEKVISNSRLYKCAGNSVTVSVIMALLMQLGVGAQKWNDLSQKERRKLVLERS